MPDADGNVFRAYLEDTLYHVRRQVTDHFDGWTVMRADAIGPDAHHDIVSYENTFTGAMTKAELFNDAPTPSSYIINISEAQRAIIEDALRDFRFNNPDHDLDHGDELDILIQMWSGLDCVEIENPRILHGLCL